MLYEETASVEFKLYRRQDEHPGDEMTEVVIIGRRNQTPQQRSTAE